jgi:hypothetical protein
VSAVIHSRLTAHWLQSNYFPFGEHSSNDIRQIIMSFVIRCHGNNACPCYISYIYIYVYIRKAIENTLIGFLYATLT